MTAQSHPHRSPRPICPDPGCKKVWAPDKRTAKQLRAEIIAEKRGAAERVRYYEHAGGWHWTRQVSLTRSRTLPDLSLEETKTHESPTKKSHHGEDDKYERKHNTPN